MAGISPQDGISETAQTRIAGVSSGGVSDVTAAGTASPANTVAPALSGESGPGDTVTCSSGTWTGTPTAYLYSWLLDGVTLAWANASTVVVQDSWVGSTLQCQVTAYNANGNASAMSDVYSIIDEPVADFSGDPLSGDAPLTVDFTDESTGAPTSWLWEKNDGGGWADFDDTPTAQNPSEDLDAGTWSIRLTATNAAGGDTKTRTDYVEAAGGSYTGPLDLVPGAVVAFGVRALSAAWLGGNLFKLRRDSDDAEVIYTADAVTGDAPVATIATWIGNPFDKTGAVSQLGNDIILTNAIGVAVGQPITGADIPANTFVTDVSLAPTITISNTPTGDNAAETLTFTPRGYLSLFYDQSGGGNNAANTDVTSQAYFVSSFKGGKCGFAKGLGNSFVDAGTGVVFSGGGCTMLCLSSVGLVGAGDGSPNVAADANNSDNLLVNFTGSISLLLYDGDEGNQAGGATDAIANGIYVLDTNWAFGAKTAFLDGVSQAFTSDDDSGGAIPSLAFDTDFFIQFRDGFAEWLFYGSSIAAGSRIPARQNIATYYGITLP